MRAEVCTTCEGWCCRDGSEMHSPHQIMVYHKHVCPDCRSGMVWTTHDKSDAKPVWTAADERAAVAAWLRTVAPNAPTRRGADELAWCADAIERGAHRTGEGT